MRGGCGGCGCGGRRRRRRRRLDDWGSWRTGFLARIFTVNPVSVGAVPAVPSAGPRLPPRRRTRSLGCRSRFSLQGSDVLPRLLQVLPHDRHLLAHLPHVRACVLVDALDLIDGTHVDCDIVTDLHHVDPEFDDVDHDVFASVGNFEQKTVRRPAFSARSAPCPASSLPMAARSIPAAQEFALPRRRLRTSDRPEAYRSCHSSD